MIALAAEKLVLEMLAQGGHTMAAIARSAGVSAATAYRLQRTGPRNVDPMIRAKPNAATLRPFPVGPKHRCPGCGAPVLDRPCRACRARRVRAELRQAGRRIASGLDEPLRLELSPAEHARYLQVRPAAIARHFAGVESPELRPES